MDRRSLPDPQAQQVLLIDGDLNVHSRRVHHLHKCHAGANLIALLHLAHGSLFVDRVQYHNPVQRRMHLEQRGIGLGVRHGLAIAVQLDLQDANRRLRGFAFQLVGLL